MKDRLVKLSNVWPKNYCFLNFLWHSLHDWLQQQQQQLFQTGLELWSSVGKVLQPITVKYFLWPWCKCLCLQVPVRWTNPGTKWEQSRAPQMAHRMLPLPPAVEEQGEVYQLVLLICCKQKVNLLMVTSTTALLLMMHLCSDPVPDGEV